MKIQVVPTSSIPPDGRTQRRGRYDKIRANVAALPAGKSLKIDFATRSECSQAYVALTKKHIVGNQSMGKIELAIRGTSLYVSKEKK